MAASINTVAKTFKALHVPGKPVMLANVWDGFSAKAVAGLEQSTALATASYAVAASYGLADNDLTLEQNLAAAKVIVGAAAGKPVTVDAQDGYGDRLAETIQAVIRAGAVGVNLEDVNNKDGDGTLYSVAEGADRVRRAMDAARAAGVPDFVVNARTDVQRLGGSVDDVVERGRQYLAAGATTVFPFPVGQLTADDVARYVREFGGMVSISARMGSADLSPQNLARLGVARVSIGPQLQFVATQAMVKQAADWMFA